MRNQQRQTIQENSSDFKTKQKKNKTIEELREETKSALTKEDLPVGTRVKIVTPCQDFHFWYGETGVVDKNACGSRWVNVRLDQPRHYEGGMVLFDFGFLPEDLAILEFPKERDPRLRNFESPIVIQHQLVIYIERAYCPHCEGPPELEYRHEVMNGCDGEIYKHYCPQCGYSKYLEKIYPCDIKEEAGRK